MTIFRAIKTINLLYVIGIYAVTIFHHIIQVNPESSVQGRLTVILVVLFLSIPNVLSVVAVSPKLKLAKTTIVLNVICILLFGTGLVAHEQEPLAIYWAATVISICAMNVAVLISALVRKRGSQPGDNVVYP